MTTSQITNWIKRSGLYEAVQGSENLTISQQVTLVGALAEINNRTDIIADAKKALSVLNG